MPREHLLNADFDLSLRPRWRWPEGEAARRRITDLAWHALFLAEPRDSVIVPEEMPDDFADYLLRTGIEPPSITVDPAIRRAHTLSPFGWNADAVRRNLKHRTPAEHPDPDTVNRVNGRLYSARLEEMLFGGGHTSAVAATVTELRDALELLPSNPNGWVVKAEHGNAGLGNRRLRDRRLEEADLKVIRRCFDEDDRVLLERWRPRTRDLCATFEVKSSGGISRIGLHETVNTADGALIGNLFETDPRPLDRWRAELTEAASRVAEKLASEGYFGPACMDAFVWDDDGRSRLRPLVDLNARREMSAGPSALWRRLGGRGAAYWRFFTRRKFDFPSGYPDFERALGAAAYDPRSCTGALITAPLWLGSDRSCPTKAAMLILGRDREAVFAVDREIRERFEK